MRRSFSRVVERSYPVFDSHLFIISSNRSLCVVCDSPKSACTAVLHAERLGIIHQARPVSAVSRNISSQNNMENSTTRYVPTIRTGVNRPMCNIDLR
ncbi:Protein of unknown function [Pyronema omphalodes CBS 100304]|uniref:Uncharacterized protein n=1 Tax=Pyronema omphalodes (strain CBS 100304) TaxID=1076935 RepID=U4L7B5_PYROM|nr:Protein of unknown function [Pyronema omphalodes CBS 100304]